MPVAKLKEYLDGKGVKYVCIIHSCAYTAQETAESAHIPGKELAKTVMVKLDGEMAMAVLPASGHVDLELLRAAAGADKVSLAGENEFRDSFPQCEVGAMPPFGNLYGMNVYVEEELADDREIAFNAGSHSELVKLSFQDYLDLVKPRVLKLSDRYSSR